MVLYHAKLLAYFLKKMRSSPDGDGFLLDQEDLPEVANQINVVLNWFEELKRLVPTP
jgi:hypothetical protein